MKLSYSSLQESRKAVCIQYWFTFSKFMKEHVTFAISMTILGVKIEVLHVSHAKHKTASFVQTITLIHLSKFNDIGPALSAFI